MIIRDRETGSLWQHATGEALAGPLQGTKLTLLGGELITWAGWQKAHPNTLAALEPDEWTGMMPKERVTAVLDKVTSHATVPGKTRRDTRLPTHETIIGIIVDDTARAYPLAGLRRLGTVEEMVNGRQISVIFDANHDSVQAFADNDQLFPQRTWWAGWYEFHPQTTIFDS